MTQYWFVFLLVADRLTPFSWFIVVAGLLAWKLKPKELFVSSVLLGIMHDVIWVEDFGWMSLGLVVLSGISLFARNKLGKGAFWLWLVLLAIFQFGYSFLMDQKLPWLFGVAQVLIASVLWRLLNRSKHSSEVYLQ